MKTAKRVLSVMLAIIIIATTVPVAFAASATSGSCGTFAKWSYSDGTLTISGKGDMYDYSVKTGNTIHWEQGYDLESTTVPWASYINKIKSVVIKSGVTGIGEYAFSFCPSLKSVKIADTVLTIRKFAFMQSGIESITLPDTVEDLESRIFNYCTSLKTVKLPAQTTKIPEGLFSDCIKLEKLTLPKSLITIEREAFYSCKSLKSIDFPSSLKYLYDSFSNCHSLTKIVFNTDVPTGLSGDILSGIGREMVVYCPSKFFKNYQSLFLEFLSNNYEATGESLLLTLCTGSTPATITNSSIVFEGSKKTNYLYAGVGNVTDGVSVKWYSMDSSIASIDSNGQVKSGKNHGRTILYGLVTYKGNTSLKVCYVKNMRNDSLVKFLPTKNVKADFPVDISTVRMTEMYTGKLIGFDARRAVEKDKSNKYYQEILALTKSLIANCKTDREKAYAIMKWVNSNIEYGGYLSIGTTVEAIYQVYVDRASHCMGYSRLTSLMLYMAGLPNGYVRAYGHQWNIALLDEKWTMIDSTWGEFDFDYNDSQHGYIEDIAFGLDGLSLIVNDATGLKLCGIGESRYDRDSIKTVTVPDYVTTIYGHALSNSKTLKKVTIGKGVKHIYSSAFSDDVSLKEIYFKGDKPSISSSAFNDVPTQSLIIYRPDGNSTWNNLDDIFVKCEKWEPSTGKIVHSYTKSVTKATLSKNGKIVPTCSVCGAKKTATTVYYPKTFKLSKTSYIYDGKAKKPTVTVTDSNGKTIASSNYTVKYTNNTAIGTATVKVTFKGNYSGTKSLTFKIKPKQVTGLKASSVATTSLKLSWTKLSGAKYYKVEKYDSANKKWVAVKTVETNSLTVKSLKAGTKYQFRVTALNSSKKVLGKASATLKTGTKTAAPTVTLKSTKSKTATASWKKVTGASKYIVYKSTDNKKFTKVTTTDKLTYNLTKLTGGKKIYVKVIAVNAYKVNSAASKVVSVTVKK